MATLLKTMQDLKNRGIRFRIDVSHEGNWRARMGDDLTGYTMENANLPDLEAVQAFLVEYSQ